MADLTDSISEVATETHRLLDENKVGLGLQDVWYGDQEKIPRVPCVAVESGPKTRVLNGAPRRTMVTMDVYILIYYGRIADGQLNQRTTEELSEAVELLLHQNEDLSGLVVSSLVISNEPGLVTRGGAQLKASRLTFQCTSQKMLPYSA